MAAANPPRFSPVPEPLPNLARQKAALDAHADSLAPNADDAKKILATIHGLSLAGESTDAIAKLVGVTRGQVLFAQRVLRARGELADQAATAVSQFKHEGIMLAIEGATEKLKAGDGAFITRMLEEGGVWANSRSGQDGEGGRGAINPGLPTLNVNINMPPGVTAPEKVVFGQVIGTPKTLAADTESDGPHPAVQHRKQG